MKLKTKIMFGLPAVLIVVMVVSTIFVSLLVYRQQKDASRNTLKTSFGIIRQDIQERQAKLTNATKQMSTAQEFGSKVQFIVENSGQGEDVDFALAGSQYSSMFRSEYVSMAESIYDVASTSGISEVRLYDINGKFMLGMKVTGDTTLLVISHDEKNKEMVFLNKNAPLASAEWQKAETLDPALVFNLESELPKLVKEDFCLKDDRIGIYSQVPVMGALYNAEIDDFAPAMFGSLIAVQYFDQLFVDKSASVADTQVNLFLPNRLSHGTLPAQRTIDFSKFPATAKDWKLATQEAIQSDAKVNGKTYFQAALPLYSDAKCIGALTSMIPVDKAKEGTIEVIWALVIIFICCLAIVFPASIYASKSTITHVREVVDRLKDISEGEGDLTVRLNIHSKDEIGELAQNFNVFIEKIHAIVSQIKESANALATASSQISATSSQLSTSSMETSTTVLELSTTAEEVKQTTSVANEKAETVAREAEATAQISESGREATEEAIQGMQRIKDEMEYIAESIVKLSEHTHSIGEIIDAVADLANESNLLSVNASIEAAKAGEYGKGFGVVAQEVKSLADLSKQATSQVRTILNDIQSATSASVMATERGSKAVDMGETLASRSGESIRALAASVVQASNSATQIAASSQQQLVGIEQLSQALDSITEASKQNTDGAKQLETATIQLHNLGQELKELASRFRL